MDCLALGPTLLTEKLGVVDLEFLSDCGCRSFFREGSVFTLVRVRPRFQFADAPFHGTGSLIYKYWPISAPYGTNNCWFPLARKWPTWKWTWIWILYGKIEKKCPRYFRRDSRGNPRDLNMCRTGRSAALSRGRKSMPPQRESMKLVVQQRKFT